MPKRTPEHTRKVYFFDGKVSQLPEVVSPHDHRYDFTTTVLAGVMSTSTLPRDGQLGNSLRPTKSSSGGPRLTGEMGKALGPNACDNDDKPLAQEYLLFYPAFH